MKTEIANTKATDQLNILIVDDQEQKLLTYEAILASLGERLVRAKTGTGALEALLREEIAVILLDVNMPGMDGFETAATIRRHPRLSRTPIIFVTAVNTTELDCARGYDLGAVDYVSVPIVPEILRAKVSVFVDLSRKTRQLERANQSLRKSEQQIRTILETATDSIITMSASGDILTVNPATERIFGYNASEMTGQNVQKFMPLSWRLRGDTTYAYRNGILLSGAEQEVHGLRKDRSFIPLEVSVSEAMTGAVFTAIIRDVSQRKQLEREIREIAAAEQRRIGQELHDDVSQELTGLRMMASAAMDQARDPSESFRVLMSRVVEGLQTAQERVRQVFHGLIPFDFDDMGLHAALADLAERIKRQTNIDCTFQCPTSEAVQDAPTATHLYHIGAEATNNAIRHGRPQRINIKVDIQADTLALSVEDDGVGLPQEGPRHDGVGFRLMRHRASLIGGRLHIGPAQTRGTVVVCTLPGWRRSNMPV